MAVSTLTHLAPIRGVVPHASAGGPGTTTGYQPAGREVRPDARSPRAGYPGRAPQARAPFAPPGQLPETGRPVFGKAERGQLREATQEIADRFQGLGLPRDPWSYSATVLAPGPAYGGAAYNGGGGQLANALSGPGRKPIEPKARGLAKAITGAAEDLI
jgi:hypothetical protein